MTVKVTEADREAAADALESARPILAEEVRAGRMDEFPGVQAFARHRRRALEEAARRCEEYGEINFEICSDNILMDPLLRGGPWTDENIQRSDSCSTMSTIHSAKYHACQEVAKIIRALITDFPAAPESATQ